MKRLIALLIAILTLLVGGVRQEKEEKLAAGEQVEACVPVTHEPAPAAPAAPAAEKAAPAPAPAAEKAAPAKPAKK